MPRKRNLQKSQGKEVRSMGLMRWRPFEELMSLRREMERLFDEIFERRPIRREEFHPLTDIVETENEFIVKMELPGINPDDVEITLHGDTLTIRGEKKEEQRSEKENYLRLERCYGSFQRSFTLGVPVKADEVKATFKDGILEVRVPKAEEAKPKPIKIKVEK
ncbi:Hsp20/alpha crystallin family protein [bacterium]|nr:Hsp20/alpha crystallin family protein [bacterium]